MERFQVAWGLKEVVAILAGAFVLTEVFVFFYDMAGLGDLLGCPGTVLAMDPCQMVAIQGVFSGLLVALTFLLLRHRGEGAASLGLTPADLKRKVLLGCGAGAGLFLLGQAMDRVTSALWGTSPLQEMLLEGAKEPAALPALLLVGSVFAPLSEEIYFRGLAYPAFRRLAGVRMGIILCSLYFAAAHLDPRAFLSLAVVSIGLTYLYERTGSLLPSLAAHFLINTLSFVLAFLGIF
jgi:membrane protease YdiL (CAAX protease family)